MKNYTTPELKDAAKEEARKAFMEAAKPVIEEDVTEALSTGYVAEVIDRIAVRVQQFDRPTMLLEARRKGNEAGRRFALDSAA